MSVKAILFDLDGTLLPMDQEEFTKAYFGALVKKLALFGYEPKKTVDAVWQGVSAMVKNDGTKTNEEAFWQNFSKEFCKDCLKDKPIFDEFYSTDFDAVRAVCQYNQSTPKLITYLKEKGIRIIIATNPLFPAVATKKRINWAGIDLGDIEYFTTYENSSFCKPNINYYSEILEKLELNPQECAMVGNDAFEDMVAKDLGLEVFLLTDCLVNSKNIDISSFEKGGFDQLFAFLENKIQKN